MLILLVPALLAAPVPPASRPVAPTPRRPELAVGVFVGQHAPQELGTLETGLAWGGRARVRWREAWGLEAAIGSFPSGVAGNLALVHFVGNPSADLVGHLAAGFGLRDDRVGLASFGGGFDVVLTPWLDLRADGRLELGTDGGSALLFAVAPMFHTRRAYDFDADGVPDRADSCPHEAEDRDGHLDIDGCPDPDNDADGVLDVGDACPDMAEDKDGRLDKDGCPDPDDDEDGVFDAIDGCLGAAEDVDGFEDADGCPDPDNDGDLVRDEVDRCTDVGEDPDGYEDDDGCPEPDNDGDGLADRWDDAPLAAETYNGWLDTDGVPDVLPPVLARLLGPLDVDFVPGPHLPNGRRPLLVEGDGPTLLGQVLASFPAARVELVVNVAAHGELVRERVIAAGADAEHVVVVEIPDTVGVLVRLREG